MKEVESHKDLKSQIGTAEKYFLLLFKKGSEISDCAFKNIEAAYTQTKGLKLLFANVAVTKDIHKNYGITTVPALIEFFEGAVKNVYKGCSESVIYKNIFEESVYFQEAEKNKNSQKNVTVYSTPSCVWCNTLKSYLRQQRVLFTDVDISRDENAAQELVRRSGQMGVPQTEIDGEMIVGFNKARINELLSLKG